jgi:hypothetical protein
LPDAPTPLTKARSMMTDAKRDETRQRRVRTSVERCRNGRKPGIDL